jgi:hypothetical protein
MKAGGQQKTEPQRSEISKRQRREDGRRPYLSKSHREDRENNIFVSKP